MVNSDSSPSTMAGGLCFVIGPIGSPDSDTRKHADQLFTHIIEPAAVACGLSRVERADQIEGSGNISSEIVARLSEAKIVVADLSEANPNVYYELAIRHVLSLPFAHLIRVGDDLPFDLAGNRAIRFDLHDLDSAATARDELQKAIRVEVSKSTNEIETPFTVALDLQAVLQQRDAEGNPELAELARVVSRVESMQRELSVAVRDIRRDARASEHLDRARRHASLRGANRNRLAHDLDAAQARRSALTAERTAILRRLDTEEVSASDREALEAEASRMETEIALVDAEIALAES